MKKTLFTLCLLVSAFAVRAQEGVSEWLTAFNDVVIEGAMDVTMVHIADTEAPKIIYDTRGSYTTKFRAEVKERVLYVRERTDARRPERTTVTIYYNTMASLTVTDAKISFEKILKHKMLDIDIAGKASLTADVEVKDLAVSISGDSQMTLMGRTTYLSVVASSGVFDGKLLESQSAWASAQNGARVTVDAKDRLECSSATNGKVRYISTPDLLRTERKFMAGDIQQLK